MLFFDSGNDTVPKFRRIKSENLIRGGGSNKDGVGGKKTQKLISGGGLIRDLKSTEWITLVDW